MRGTGPGQLIGDESRNVYNRRRIIIISELVIVSRRLNLFACEGTQQKNEGPKADP
jgi:hypothetical protein